MDQSSAMAAETEHSFNLRSVLSLFLFCFNFGSFLLLLFFQKMMPYTNWNPPNSPKLASPAGMNAFHQQAA